MPDMIQPGRVEPDEVPAASRRARRQVGRLGGPEDLEAHELRNERPSGDQNRPGRSGSPARRAASKTSTASHARPPTSPTTTRASTEPAISSARAPPALLATAGPQALVRPRGPAGRSPGRDSSFRRDPPATTSRARPSGRTRSPRSPPHIRGTPSPCRLDPRPRNPARRDRHATGTPRGGEPSTSGSRWAITLYNKATRGGRGRPLRAQAGGPEARSSDKLGQEAVVLAPGTGRPPGSGLEWRRAGRGRSGARRLPDRESRSIRGRGTLGEPAPPGAGSSPNRSG